MFFQLTKSDISVFFKDLSKSFFSMMKKYFSMGFFLKFISWLRRIDSDAFLVDWSMLHRLYIAIYSLRPKIYHNSRFQNNSLHIHIFFSEKCIYTLYTHLENPSKVHIHTSKISQKCIYTTVHIHIFFSKKCIYTFRVYTRI